MDVSTGLAAVLVVIGLVGVVVPVLPGLWVTVAGVAVWAVPYGGAAGWTCLAICVALGVAGTVLQYLLPGRRMREQGVRGTTLMAGGLLGVVGFFVIPVVGLFVGFVLGVYLAELTRLRDPSAAWPSTRRALAAVGWSMAIEFTTALMVTGVWIATLLLT